MVVTGMVSIGKVATENMVTEMAIEKMLKEWGEKER